MGEDQVSSQETFENLNSLSTPRASNYAKRNVILFGNDRSTKEFDMKFPLSELQSYYSSFIQHNIRRNSTLALKSSHDPTDDFHNNLPNLARASSELDPSSKLTMPKASHDISFVCNNAAREVDHGEVRNLERINEES